MNRFPYHTINGIQIHNISLKLVLENILLRLKKVPLHRVSSKNPLSDPAPDEYILPIVTVNPEFIMRAQSDRRFRKALNNSFIAVPDGSGILLAGLLKGRRFTERITGIQLVHECTKLAAEHDLTIGFIGGKKGASSKTLDAFIGLYPHLRAWSHEGPDLEVAPEKNGRQKNQYFTRRSIKNIHGFMDSIPSNLSVHNVPHMKPAKPITVSTLMARTHILFVAFGAPKQEFFIEYLKDYLKHPRASQKDRSFQIIALGVGGSFDEIAGLVRRCPEWIDRAGLKWLFRLVTEPHRLRRQIALFRFALQTLSPWR